MCFIFTLTEAKPSIIPELFCQIWWRRRRWCGRCSLYPVGWCRALGSCATCSSLDLLIPADTQEDNILGWHSHPFVYQTPNKHLNKRFSKHSRSDLKFCTVNSFGFISTVNRSKMLDLASWECIIVGWEYQEVTCQDVHGRYKSSTDLRPAELFRSQKEVKSQWDVRSFSLTARSIWSDLMSRCSCPGEHFTSSHYSLSGRTSAEEPSEAFALSWSCGPSRARFYEPAEQCVIHGLFSGEISGDLRKISLMSRNNSDNILFSFRAACVFL